MAGSLLYYVLLLVYDAVSKAENQGGPWLVLGWSFQITLLPTSASLNNEQTEQTECGQTQQKLRILYESF